MPSNHYKSKRQEWRLDTIEKCKDVLLARQIMLKRRGPYAGILAALEFLYDIYPEFKEMNCTQEYIASEILGISRFSLTHALGRRWKNGTRHKREQEQTEVRPEAEENTARQEP